MNAHSIRPPTVTTTRRAATDVQLCYNIIRLMCGVECRMNWNNFCHHHYPQSDAYLVSADSPQSWWHWSWTRCPHCRRRRAMRAEWIARVATSPRWAWLGTRARRPACLHPSRSRSSPKAAAPPAAEEFISNTTCDDERAGDGRRDAPTTHETMATCWRASGTPSSTRGNSVVVCRKGISHRAVYCLIIRRRRRRAVAVLLTRGGGLHDHVAVELGALFRRVSLHPFLLSIHIAIRLVWYVFF